MAPEKEESREVRGRAELGEGRQKEAEVGEGPAETPGWRAAEVPIATVSLISCGINTPSICPPAPTQAHTSSVKLTLFISAFSERGFRWEWRTELHSHLGLWGSE